MCPADRLLTVESSARRRTPWQRGRSNGPGRGSRPPPLALPRGLRHARRQVTAAERPDGTGLAPTAPTARHLSTQINRIAPGSGSRLHRRAVSSSAESGDRMAGHDADRTAARTSAGPLPAWLIWPGSIAPAPIQGVKANDGRANDTRCDHATGPGLLGVQGTANR